MPKDIQANKAEVIEREEKVLEMILEGAGNIDIYDYAKEKWNLGSRQAERYVSKCVNFLETKSKKKKSKLIERHIKRREKLLSDALSFKIPQFKTALEILKDIANLEQLYKIVIKSEHEETITYNVKLSSEERPVRVSERLRSILREAEPSNN